MTANAGAQAIKPELLRTCTEDFNKDCVNLITADVVVSTGVFKTATDYRGVHVLPYDSSIELRQGSITNQEHSGRCWMFTSLNTLYYGLMHRWNFEDFEFSETYLFFWDTVEKSNTYLENVLRTLDGATDSRLFEVISGSPADDGGWWQIFAALVNKYGLVSESACLEFENSHNSDDFKQYLNSKLRESATELRHRSAAEASEDELRVLKDEYVSTTYRICTVALDEPSERLDFSVCPKDNGKDKKDEACKCEAEAGADGKVEPCRRDESCKCEDRSDAKAYKCDKDKSDKPKTDEGERPQICEIGITPLGLYKKYVSVDVNDFVTLVNALLRNRPFDQRYRIRFSANVVKVGDAEFVNMPLNTFKKAALDQLTVGHPTWFACDCTQLALHEGGFSDQSVVRVDQLFGAEFAGDKAYGLECGDSLSSHAMTFTGVSFGEDGKPNRWKVENSWGRDVGKGGYCVMSDVWLGCYVIELITCKEYLDDTTRTLLTTEPVELDPWQSLTRHCR